jgi:hypothetical protein
MNHPVFIGHLDVTPAVEMVAAGDNSLEVIRAKLLEIVKADESVEPDEAEILTDNVLVAYRDFGLWIPEVSMWRLNHKFVTSCPVCTLDLLSQTETNLMVVDKFRSGPLEDKARFVSCIVCDLVLQPLRIIQYTVKASKKAAKNGETGDAIMGVAVQGLEPVGVLVPDLTDAGIIVRTLSPDRLELFPKFWESSAGILEGYQQRVASMVMYWDQQDELKKPAPRPKLFLADGSSSLH